MTCSSAFLVPAAAAPCALLARLNAALLLPAWMQLTSSCYSNKIHQVKHKQVYWPRPRRRRRPRTGAWRGSWPWGNPRYGSWPWENPRNDFLAILHSKDQHLLNYMNMNLCCKEEKHLERDHGFSTACLSMTSHYVPVTVDWLIRFDCLPTNKLFN